MSEKLPIAPRWLILQTIGAIILALGVSESIGVIQLIPESWRFPYYGWAIAAMGLFIELPVSIAIIREAQGKSLNTAPDKIPGID